MKKITLLFFLILCFSCLEDDLTSSMPDDPNSEVDNDLEFQENFGAIADASFYGRIIDATGQPIVGAQIDIGTVQTNSDLNGFFVVNDVSVFERFAYIKASKEGFLDGSRVVVPQQDEPNYVIITLLEKNVVGTVNSGEVSEVTYENTKIISNDTENAEIFNTYFSTVADSIGAGYSFDPDSHPSLDKIR